jgi:putative component of toxin-antitoxin plasmid stabilization module
MSGKPEVRAEQVGERSLKFELVFFVEDDGKPVVRDWLRSLSLTKKQALGTAMREVLQELGAGVCATEFGKQLGKGVFEFRLRQKPGEVRSAKGSTLPPERILLRVFCHAFGRRLVLLLGGYDKSDDTSKKRQSKELEAARARLRRWQARRKGF